MSATVREVRMIEQPIIPCTPHFVNIRGLPYDGRPQGVKDQRT